MGIGRYDRNLGDEVGVMRGMWGSACSGGGAGNERKLTG